jgi:hypothetical protein
LQLVAIGAAEILLDLDVKLGIAQTNLVPNRRAIEIDILLTRDLCHLFPSGMWMLFKRRYWLVLNPL